MSLDISINCKCCESELFEKNITHNLGKMAGEAGVYKALWRPEEINCKYAKDILPILEKGLEELKSDPKKYKQFNPENGWGKYESLVIFVGYVIDACKKYPEGILRISR